MSFSNDFVMKWSLGCKPDLGWFWGKFINQGVPYLDLGILDSEQGFQIVDFNYICSMKMECGKQIGFGMVLGRVP